MLGATACSLSGILNVSVEYYVIFLAYNTLIC